MRAESRPAGAGRQPAAAGRAPRDLRGSPGGGETATGGWAATGLPEGQERLLTGWGRTAPTRATVIQPQGVEDLDAVLWPAVPRGLIAHGLGRSYGDAAQNAGGVVAELTCLNAIRALDLQTGTVTVGAGLSLGRLQRLLVPLGWFPPVVAGTGHVTVGGAIAADIHGKNHHRRGSFCAHVSAVELHTPAGRGTITPHDDHEVFWATAGGMGLTGIVTAATLKLQPVQTAAMVVDTERVSDLDDCLARMHARDHAYQYSVAWVDLLAGGRARGRGVLQRGDHARVDVLPARARLQECLQPRTRLTAPAWVPGGLLNWLTVRAFNQAWFRLAPRLRHGEVVPLDRFFHPLDAVAGWNRLYGPRGLVQYQFLVPLGQEEVLRRVVERLQRGRVPAFLAVLKRFGAANPGPLSFAAPGWTLALDMPAAVPGLAGLLDQLDEEVAAAGGRVYLAKDARLRPDLLPAMYPRLEEWRAARRRVDPHGVLRSDLARRLGL